MSQPRESITTPFIIGAIVLFTTGAIATVLLPFFEDTMKRPNANAEIRNYAADSPEYRGRQIYIREGCHTCHTQFVRPTKGDMNLGPVSVPQDYYYDSPVMQGTVRTGADLMWVGRRTSPAWHKAHLKNPRDVLPGSIMPSYNYLTEQETDDLIAYLMSLKPAPSTAGTGAPSAPIPTREREGDTNR
ncbi:cbb3-type cytochrome c oxidase subunit II [Brevibacillus dissolubilis]|uniref:cbb3-type cytochrome c oxidase subunit II n=1 Tax=Brevibacillus dissolubilis TaxID=1844116 RepID=UPI0011162225|nr:cbb3-type cytochrome c oxidase subunit II [Brevibacillus dissolubilis]